jgi:hypothetical protein
MSKGRIQPGLKGLHVQTPSMLPSGLRRHMAQLCGPCVLPHYTSSIITHVASVSNVIICSIFMQGTGVLESC